MKEFSANKVKIIAAMLTEDPDILREWTGGPGMAAKLGAATGIRDPRQLQSLSQEFDQFMQYRPSLQQQGEEAAIQAFVTYKKTGKMPGNSDPATLDQRGGEFGGGEGRQGKTGYY